MKVLASRLEAFFKIKERGSTITKELLGGLTIFLAMVYVLPVNADMLSKTGMSFAAVFAATAIAAAIASIIMGMLANYPVGLASGMGVNAFFTYTVCFGLQFSWQEALAAVLISGILFLIVSITGLRTLSTSPVLSRHTSAPCSVKGKAPSAGWLYPVTRRTSTRPMRRSWSFSPKMSTCTAG